MYRCTDEIRTQRRIEREKAFPKIVGIHIGEKVKVPVLMVSDKTARYLEAVVEYIDRDLDFVTVRRMPERRPMADPYARLSGYCVSVAPDEIRRHGR
ncbi:MAG: hypothetical protein ACLU62_06225 [Hydrogeniiclostridium sp.]